MGIRGEEKEKDFTDSSAGRSKSTQCKIVLMKKSFL